MSSLRGIAALGKGSIQELIRLVHVVAARRELPGIAGVYFHDLPQNDWPAFEEAVRTLRRAGYRFASADDLFDTPSGPIVFLSFDDNFASWYESVALLDDCGVRATFYVNTLPLCVGPGPELNEYATRIGVEPSRYTPLSEAQLKELAYAGHVIGSHTHSHFRLSELSLPDAERDISTAVHLLRDLLGKEISHFSFPYGMLRFFPDQLRDSCEKLGLRTIANGTPGMLHAGHTPTSIQRSLWRLTESSSRNLMNLRIDGRIFHRLTGRSAVG